MEFQYFIKGYDGRDLHFVRSNQEFNINKFFVTQGKSVSFEIGLPLSIEVDDPNNSNVKIQTYENIVFSTNKTNTTHDLSIKASTHSVTADKVNNFYILVTVESQTTRILVFIHDSIEKVWLTPNILTVRENINNIKFGVRAKFSGEIIADLSYYPDLAFSQHTGFPSYLEIDNTTFRIKKINSQNWPNPIPSNPINDCIKITLPAYLNSLNAYGSLSVADKGLLIPITPDAEKSMDDKVNVLFIPDGFTDITVAKKFVTDTVAQIQSETAKPWSLMNNNVNYWMFFAKSREEGGGIRETNLELSSNNKFQLVDSNTILTNACAISTYVYLCDRVLKYIPFPAKDSANNSVELGQMYNMFSRFDDILGYFPWKSPDLDYTDFPVISKTLLPIVKSPVVPSVITKILSLNTLIKIVGYPSKDDVWWDSTDNKYKHKTFQSKRTEWVNLNWIPSNGIVQVYGSGEIDIKYPGQSANSSDFYFPEVLFESWLKLGKRVDLDIPDTSFGISRYVNIEDASIDFDGRMIENKEVFNKIIGDLKYNDVNNTLHNVGQLFFDSNNNYRPVFNVDYEIVAQNNVTTHYKTPKNSNNIIFLSKIPKFKIGGINRSYPYVYTDSQNNVIRYTENISIVSVYDNKSYVTNCIENSNFSVGSIRTNVFRQQPLQIDKIGLFAKNSVIHEWGHNFLLDEYNISPNGGVDFNTLSSSQKTKINESVRYSNLQSKDTIINNSGDIVSDNIRWYHWPRILKVATSADDLKSENSDFLFLVKSKSAEFSEGEHILLRSKNLYKTQYYKFIVKTIKYQGDPNKIIIEPVSGVSINVTDFKKGCMILLPNWNNDKTDYDKIIHTKVAAIINTQKKGLVDEDIKGYDVQKQTLVAVKDRLKHLVVGLYPGATIDNVGYRKNLFHPTGYCLMRSTDNKDDRKGNSYCHVCKYILVDNLDPIMHPTIDKDYYESIYKELNELQ